MIKLIKKLFDYIFDIDNCRSEVVIKESLTGKPLIIMTRNCGFKTTKEGLAGAHISLMITQLGQSVETIKNVLNGNSDDYLSQGDKDNLVQNIKIRLEKGGEYLYSSRNIRGDLDFKRGYWDKNEIDEIVWLTNRYKRGYRER